MFFSVALTHSSIIPSGFFSRSLFHSFVREGGKAFCLENYGEIPSARWESKMHKRLARAGRKREKLDVTTVNVNPLHSLARWRN